MCDDACFACALGAVTKAVVVVGWGERVLHKHRPDTHTRPPPKTKSNRDAYGAADAAVAMHPGLVHTELATGFFKRAGGAAPSSSSPSSSAIFAAPRAALGAALDALFPLTLRTPESSAANVLAVATAPAAAVAGRYFSNDRLARPSKVRRWRRGGGCCCAGRVRARSLRSRITAPPSHTMHTPKTHTNTKVCRRRGQVLGTLELG